MQVLYVEDVADHDDPESCVVIREGGGEALTGAHVGWVLSPEMLNNRDADAVEKCGRQHEAGRHGESCTGPAWSETPCTHGNHLHGNREIPGPPTGDDANGPRREGFGRTPPTHGPGKSDPSIHANSHAVVLEKVCSSAGNQLPVVSQHISSVALVSLPCPHLGSLAFLAVPMVDTGEAGGMLIQLPAVPVAGQLVDKFGGQGGGVFEHGEEVIGKVGEASGLSLSGRDNRRLQWS
jgi:hypothetical protein